jgi:hypothetical protein
MRSVRSLFLRMWNGVASYNRRFIERCNRGGSVADPPVFVPADIERMTADPRPDLLLASSRLLNCAARRRQRFECDGSPWQRRSFRIGAFHIHHR